MLDVDAVSFPRLSAIITNSHVTGHDRLAWPLVSFFEKLFYQLFSLTAEVIHLAMHPVLKSSGLELVSLLVGRDRLGYLSAWGHVVDWVKRRLVR